MHKQSVLPAGPLSYLIAVTWFREWAENIFFFLHFQTFCVSSWRVNETNDEAAIFI